MKKELDMVKLTQWAQVIQSANESNLGRRKWCKLNGISTSSFYYWQKKVRKYALDKMTNSPIVDDSIIELKKNVQLPQNDFYEISLGDIGSAEVVPAVKAPVGPGIEIKVSIKRKDFCVEISEGFSKEVFSSILEVVNHV